MQITAIEAETEEECCASQYIELDSIAAEIETVAIALSSSHCSNYAFNWSLQHFLSHSLTRTAKIMLLTVQETLSPRFYFGGNEPYLEAYEGKRRSYEHQVQAQFECAYQLLSKYRIKILEKFSDAIIEVFVLEGDPGKAIVEFANNNDVDLLIMGSRGLGALKRAFLGSVSDYCIHNLSCPIMIVKSSPDLNGTNSEEHVLGNSKIAPISA